jgi:hypothetical protein
MLNVKLPQYLSSILLRCCGGVEASIVDGGNWAPAIIPGKKLLRTWWRKNSYSFRGENSGSVFMTKHLTH